MIHVLRECETTRNEMQMEEILREKGKGLDAMKRIEQENNIR